MMLQTPPNNNIHDADSIIEVIKAGMPLGFLTLTVGILWHIAEICHERNWRQRLALILSSGAFGLVVGPIAFHMVPLIIPQASLSMCMAISCMMAAMGPQGLAMLVRFLKGCSVVSIKEHVEDIERQVAERLRHHHATHHCQCENEQPHEKSPCSHCTTCKGKEPRE